MYRGVGRCAVCQNVLTTADRISVVEGQKVHTGCLKCSKCGKTFDGPSAMESQRITGEEHGNAAMCKPCAAKSGGKPNSKPVGASGTGAGAGAAAGGSSGGLMGKMKRLFGKSSSSAPAASSAKTTAATTVPRAKPSGKGLACPHKGCDALIQRPDVEEGTMLACPKCQQRFVL